MPGRRTLLLSTLLAAALGPGIAPAQPLIPNQMLASLTVEVHSVDDAVEIYADDPQYLLKFELRPVVQLLPRIEFSNSAQAGVLRVRDLSLFEDVLPPPPLDDDDELAAEPEPEKPRMVAQDWTLRLTPSAPTSFVVHCVRGRGNFDFTNMEAHEIYLLADTAQVRVDFKRPNPIPLERLKITANAGSLRLGGLLNARPRSVTLQLDAARAELDLRGRAFDGEAEIYVEGVPERLDLALQGDAGVRVEGPSRTVLQFADAGLERDGTALQSRDYHGKRCRLRLFFSQPLPDLHVRWEE